MFKIIYSLPFHHSFVILHILIDKALITTKKLLHLDAKSYYLKIIKWIPILIEKKDNERKNIMGKEEKARIIW